jgi:hypothetical protein
VISILICDLERMIRGPIYTWDLGSSVADPPHFDVDADQDPDLACPFDADPDLDTACHFDGGPDPDATFQFLADPDPRFQIGHIQIHFGLSSAN